MSEMQNDQNPPAGESKASPDATRLNDQDLQKVHSQLMREKEEPSENFSPMPLFFVALFMVLSFWGGIYLVHYSGDFGPFHYDETMGAGAAEAAGPREVDMMALGARVYSQNCVACHQGSGMGLPGVVESDWGKDKPVRLVKMILAGLAGPVMVNGAEYNNAMTPFNKLKDQQIAAVLTYIRTNPDYANNSFAVSEELVAAVRAEYGARTDPWSQVELEAIHGPVTGAWEPPAPPEPEVIEETAPEEGVPEEVVETGEAPVS